MEIAQLFKPLSKPIQQILIIDDDQITVFLARKQIEVNYPNIQINYFLDAAKALEAIKNQLAKPDLILLDLNMPDLDGWQFLHQFMQFEYTCDVVILTSSIDEDDFEKSKNYLHVKGFISKPLTPAKLKIILG